jgi:putative ABC transport system permease protein
LSVSASSAFSVGPLIEALALACVIALGVNAGKVSALSRLSPLAVLRERTKRLPSSRWASFLTLATAAAGVFTYTFYKSNSSEVARNFSVGLLGSGAALAVLIAAGLRLFETLPPLMTGRRFFAFRHGLIELTRNKARSLIFLFTLSAGFTLIGALTLVHHSLSKEILLGKADDVPDMFLVDIQKSQREDVERMINAYVKQPPLLSPLIRARLTHINGKPILRRDLSAMTVEDRRKHRFLTREYNLTYKDRLNDSEEILEGAFWKPGESRVQISLEKGFEKMTGVALGDKMTFDIQGRSIDADVTSVRSINWMSMNPNFFVVFPESALERAPQNFVGSLRIGDPERISEFQKKLIERFPNISVVDLSQILDNIQSVLGILLTALTVVAWFCVAVGLLVLAGTLSLGHRERREHAALFRALGASFKDILLIDAFELLSIGALTFAISAAVSYGLGAYISQKMEITFSPDAAASVWILAVALALPLAVGLAVSWKTYRSPVLETLRHET